MTTLRPHPPLRRHRDRRRRLWLWLGAASVAALPLLASQIGLVRWFAAGGILWWPEVQFHQRLDRAATAEDRALDRLAGFVVVRACAFPPYVNDSAADLGQPVAPPAWVDNDGFWTLSLVDPAGRVQHVRMPRDQGDLAQRHCVEGPAALVAAEPGRLALEPISQPQQ